jgi:hypothetical protein
MEFVTQLWLPIILSGVFVWLASFIIWMASPMHKKEWGELPDDKGFMGALIEMGVQPGQYVFPCSDGGKRTKDPEFLELQKSGPTGILTVWRTPTNMGKNMVLSLIVYWIIGLFVAYIAFHALDGGEPYLERFRIAGAAAVLGYVFGGIPNDIWFGKSSKSIVTGIVDGVIYGLLTAGTFAWLWPITAS